jgi:diacylglycerol kinase (ATP)
MELKPEQCIIIVNPECQQGKGWKKWLSVREDVIVRLMSQYAVYEFLAGVTVYDEIDKLISENIYTCIISAGGDGSMHFLINYIMLLPEDIRNKICVGAIGLGSSNDFHKPFNLKIKGIPVRFNVSGDTVLSDVGIVTYSDQTGINKTEYFIINASLGLTAVSNYNFNHAQNLLKFLKKYNTDLAIYYTAVSSILSFKNIYLELTFENNTSEDAISNINILKIPYVSGTLHYPEIILPDDGKLSLQVCKNMGKWDLIKVLINLTKGVFVQNQKTISANIENMHVKSHQEFVFECDGETFTTKEATFSILPQAIKILK